MPLSRDMIPVGRITGLYGVKGRLKIHSWTRPLENIFSYKPWYIDHDGNQGVIEPLAGQWLGKHLVVKLAGIDDREMARDYIGKDIEIARSQLPPLEAGEYYWHEVIGLKVRNVDGVELGVVSEILETGANDVMVIEGHERILIPWINDLYIMDIDPGSGEILVDWRGEQ